MPILTNARWELFAENLAKGMSQEKAYIAAGYKETPLSRNHASRLSAKECIRTRVVELQTRNIEKQDLLGAISTERLLGMAEEARVLAMQQNQPAAAVTALTALAKLAGKWVERSERTTKTDDISTLSDAELAAIVRQGLPQPTVNPEAKKLN